MKRRCDTKQYRKKQNQTTTTFPSCPTPQRAPFVDWPNEEEKRATRTQDGKATADHRSATTSFGCYGKAAADHRSATTRFSCYSSGEHSSSWRGHRSEETKARARQQRYIQSVIVVPWRWGMYFTPHIFGDHPGWWMNITYQTRRCEYVGMSPEIIGSLVRITSGLAFLLYGWNDPHFTKPLLTLYLPLCQWVQKCTRDIVAICIWSSFICNVKFQNDQQKTLPRKKAAVWFEVSGRICLWRFLRGKKLLP